MVIIKTASANRIGSTRKGNCDVGENCANWRYSQDSTWFHLTLRSLSFNLKQNGRFDYQVNGVLLLKVNAKLRETDASMGVPAVNFTFTRIFWYIL